MVYAIDHGLFIGVAYYHSDPPGGGLTFNIMKCRYLFITGVSEVDAVDGQIPAPAKPAGHCRIFAE